MARNKRKKINDKDKFKGIREEAKKRSRQKKSREKAIKKGAAAIARNLANSNVREIMEQNRSEPTNPWPRRSVTVEHASKEINPSLVVRTEKFLWSRKIWKLLSGLLQRFAGGGKRIREREVSWYLE